MNDIHNLPSQSSLQQTSMSLSIEPLALRRKRTATDRAENNSDPLAANKKARAEAKAKATAQASTATKPAPGTNVSSYIVSGI